VLARLHTTAPDGQDAIPKDAFQIDLHRDPVSGPQGKTAKLYQHRRGRPAASGQRVARFPRATASPARCGRVAPRRPAPDPHQPPRRPPSSRAKQLADPAEREHLTRTRPRIERLLGPMVYRYHARTGRYRGTRKTELQAVWTAGLVNLHPIGTAPRA